MSAGGTIVRTRKIGARDVPLRFTLKDGDGNIIDISGRNVATDFLLRLVELDDDDTRVSATEFTGAGAFAFTTDGTDGGIGYTLTVSDAATVRNLQAMLTVTFASTLTDVFPTPVRYVVRFEAVI